MEAWGLDKMKLNDHTDRRYDSMGVRVEWDSTCEAASNRDLAAFLGVSEGAIACLIHGRPTGASAWAIVQIAELRLKRAGGRDGDKARETASGGQRRTKGNRGFPED